MQGRLFGLGKTLSNIASLYFTYISSIVGVIAAESILIITFDKSVFYIIIALYPLPTSALFSIKYLSAP